MLISAEIAESDPNFRNCPQYRKSQLFLNYLFADPSLVIGTENCMKRIRKKNPVFLVVAYILLMLIRGIATTTLPVFIRTIIE